MLKERAHLPEDVEDDNRDGVVERRLAEDHVRQHRRRLHLLRPRRESEAAGWEGREGKEQAAGGEGRGEGLAGEGPCGAEGAGGGGGGGESEGAGAEAGAQGGGAKGAACLENRERGDGVGRGD